MIVTGDQAGSQAGTAFDLNDIDGDGINDFIVGAPYASQQGYGGGVYVLPGPQQGYVSLSQAEGFWLADWPNARLGEVLEASSDMTGDGYIDIVVAAPERDNASGAVYLLSGGTLGEQSVGDAFAYFYGDREDARLGDSLQVYDINADGEPDLILGAPDSDISTDQGGVVYFVEGPIASGTSMPQALWYTTEDNASVGASILGTEQGIFVGAPGINFDAGEVYLLDWF